jgi:hypothetical protein
MSNITFNRDDLGEVVKAVEWIIGNDHLPHGTCSSNGA